MATTHTKTKEASIETVTVNPDPSLMLKLGQQGYSLAETLAEFVDNSIDARAGENVEVEIAIDAKKVEIGDNGVGMNKKQLVQALTVAHSSKTDALGQYGLGLKAAAVALSNAFVIDTTVEGEAIGHRVAWSAAEWAERGKWTYEIETRNSPKKLHGTSITLMALKFEPVKRVGIVKNELARRFGPFLRSGELVLRINGSKVRAPEVELLDPKEHKLQVENPQKFTLKTQSGKTLTGWVGLLASSSQKGLYGFDTFRRGRLITYNDKLGFSAHPTVARVCGEVHMDHVPVTSNKREWMKTDALYEDAEHTLAEFIGPWLAESRRLSSNANNLRPLEAKKLQDFKAGLASAFEHPDMKDYTLPIGGEAGVAGRGSRTTQIPIEERSERSDKGGEHETDGAEKPESERTRTAKQQSAERTKRMRIGGKHFDYEHKFGNLGANGPAFQHDWNPQERKLLVVSNAESPLFHVAQKDVSVVAFTQVVDAVAQVVMVETQGAFDRFDEVRQILIREAAKHVADL